MAQHAKLPPELEQPSVRDFAVGETVWVEPTAIYADDQKLLWVNAEASGYKFNIAGRLVRLTRQIGAVTLFMPKKAKKLTPTTTYPRHSLPVDAFWWEDSE